MMAKNFFYSSLIKKNVFPYKESQGMVAMTIRQSIEIKTKRILGIYKINKVKIKAKDYGFKRLFEFIEENRSDILYDPIDFEVLKDIYKWSCAYIHNGDVSFLWQTETALSYLRTYFAPGVSQAANKRSVFGAFKIRNYNSLKSKLNSFVGADYRIVFLHNIEVEAIIESN